MWTVAPLHRPMIVDTTSSHGAGSEWGAQAVTKHASCAAAECSAPPLAAFPGTVHESRSGWGREGGWHKVDTKETLRETEKGGSKTAAARERNTYAQQNRATMTEKSYTPYFMEQLSSSLLWIALEIASISVKPHLLLRSQSNDQDTGCIWFVQPCIMDDERIVD